ncbi:hypothetical protein CCR82_04875 [Halochromatium salexigens]|uniref:Uncharacterized protein n=1 Tax=Halochromatium salexigens TaxID=49447 RepID=A0AAJ0XFN6_HALSE|nr:hypothetical protein [Halochromatium salexigens]
MCVHEPEFGREPAQADRQGADLDINAQSLAETFDQVFAQAIGVRKQQPHGDREDRQCDDRGGNCGNRTLEEPMKDSRHLLWLS